MATTFHAFPRVSGSLHIAYNANDIIYVIFCNYF